VPAGPGKRLLNGCSSINELLLTEYNDRSLVGCRSLGRDIVTIREAAWLTDNTYKYEDVVRMMGEISAVLLGNFRVSAYVWFFIYLMQ